MIAIVVVGVVVVVGAVVALRPRGASEVSTAEALSDFRDRAATTTTAARPTDAAVPTDGVYTYRASGQEEVKLGPLPAENRTLPATVTAVVVDLGNGCFEWTVNLFAEHTEDTRYCVDDGRLVLDGHEKHQRVGPVSPTATMACDPGVLVDPDRATTDLACTLDLAGGPAKVSASFTGTATTAAVEEVTVGTEKVAATPLTISYDITGDVSGRWIEKLWLGADHLPLRIERDLDLDGPASFDEESSLELTDLTPST